ncbi:hypothetical protein ACLBX9_05655 [Methylobacterium sp. A49B]|uniref:Uncharacterized protein n=1 Tax=Methylobacterium mesophilicum SR1.6/6 TaxID=908290 RepID=A0A6B9FQX7_9HYPH|nr:hypothetical protein [Methylobacterium mesophilicum]QGY05021.1 hypothetical protein MMSR116_26315 [Methylobacterium mesophilicum SR1.6/6]
MDEGGIDFPRMIVEPAGESRSSRALDRIARSLDLPIAAFLRPDRHQPVLQPMTEREAEWLLRLVEVHLRQLDPSARRRFGEAVCAMLDAASAEG